MKKAGLGYAGISMDGYGETNDKFRGKKGAFEADDAKGVDNCVAEGVKVSLRFTVTSTTRTICRRSSTSWSRKTCRACVSTTWSTAAAAATS